MKKKLLKVAIGAALSAGVSVAQAGVTVGGMAQVEYFNGTAECSVGSGDSSSFTGSGNCNAGAARRQKSSGMIDNARGRIIINADEEIGSMKALARYEFSVDTANSGQENGNTAIPYDSNERTFDQRTREKYVGLQGGFGTLTLGNLHGVYKRLGGVRWDAFNATVLEARGNGGQSGGDLSSQFGHNGFIPGAIKWETDKLLGPVRMEVLVAPDSNTNSDTVGDTGNGYDYQIGFSIKPISQLEIILAHSNNKEEHAASFFDNDDAKATKVGVRGVFGGTSAFVQYEKADINDSLGGNSGTSTDPEGLELPGADASWLLLGFGQKFGSNEIVLQVGRHDRDRANGAVGGDAMYYAAGYFYNFSKTAKVWTGVRKTDFDSGTLDRETTIFSVGMRKDF